MNLTLKSIVMRAKGFEKVMLPDKKGILTPKNNHKWVKAKVEGTQGIYIRRTEVLPSGTTVEYKGELKGLLAGLKPSADYRTFQKTITKSDGKKIITTSSGDIYESCDGGFKNLRNQSVSSVLFI